ncbi:hypothetical protein [Sporolituus thermophilus]|uniref:LarA-like N-terminal domain-containing protein n=1 Tax=Sporolituus thermophilus DSM 23256 TaxID=1123285 RepID=A0A1G7PAN8_9FIRM|nr:hypothetical protein [Sporolituus thermophilus]SDF83343.1 hypothetical protein SAMN05660235_02891 [Sporolituus thermophilus DSM 23256]
MAKLPKMVRIKQIFARPRVDDASAVAAAELVKLKLKDRIKPGQTVGITVGSRGIQNILPILKTAVEHVRSLGAKPVLLAAMGSHGGGTEAGQMEVLAGLGITETNIGARIIPCAVNEVIGHTHEGIPAYILKSAREVDGILVINRVKTHTSFKGKVESGLIKKLVVGLGGPLGAQQFHGFGSAELPRLLVEIGEVLLAKLPIVGGLAIIENAYEETALIRAVAPAGMIAEESELLAYSKSLMPALPADNLDLLVIEEMGKNYSGTGIDTNIIGRARIQGVPEPEKPFIKRIAVLDLSHESHGNATGIGLADFVTKKLVDKMDRHNTYLNCLTSTFVVRAAIPMYFDTEEKLFEAALYSLSSIPPEKLRMVIIPNTLFLTECLVSEALIPELAARPGIELIGEPEEIWFDGDGNLQPRIGRTAHC